MDSVVHRLPETRDGARSSRAIAYVRESPAVAVGIKRDAHTDGQSEGGGRTDGGLGG